jgi:uncharacterized phage protein gp47/JayE
VPFARPSLASLVDRVRGDLRGRLELLGPLLRRAMADALGAVFAGAVHTSYGYLDWLSKQLFGDTAEREQLLRKAAPYGITPVPATYATGTATATGTNGTPIPAGTILRLDALTSYRVTTGQTIASGTATLPIAAVLAGSLANIPGGTSLTFESPIDFVAATATVVADIEDGVDEEGTEELRARYLLRLREPPEGGADQDYEAWALAVPGVTRAWVYENELGLGTVVVRFVRDGDVSIFPDTGEVAAVQARLDSERPMCAEVTAVAPTNLVVAFTIHLVPDNSDTRAAVKAELDDLFKREGAPGDGVSLGTIKLTHILTAIGTAAGVTDYTLTAPSANIVPGVGQLPTVGAPTWT